MPQWEDLYKILEVDPQANTELIRRAYIKKARDFHPDLLSTASSDEIRVAEEKMKEINRAYEILRHPDARKQYHQSWASRGAAPILEIEGAHIRIDEATPNQRYTGYFVVRNAGGPYRHIRIRNPDTWVKVKGYQPLQKGSELPMRVELEAEAKEWGRLYSDTVTVSLDNQEVKVKFELQTKPQKEAAKPQSSGVRGGGARTVTVGSTPKGNNGSKRLRHSAQMHELSMYTDVGRMIGAALGLCIGLFYTVLFAIDGAGMFGNIPFVGLVVGVASGAFSAIILLPLGLFLGVLMGWGLGIAGWMVHSALESLTRRI